MRLNFLSVAVYGRQDADLKSYQFMLWPRADPASASPAATPPNRE